MSIQIDGVNNIIRDNVPNIYIAVPSGTLMLFQQTAAPNGWTKQTTHNDKVLRVVSGTASSGGITTFTSVFTSRTPAGTVGNTTLTTAQIPSHTHTGYAPNHDVNDSTSQGYPYGNSHNAFRSSDRGRDYGMLDGSISYTGSSNSHTHGFTGTAMDFAVQYVDLIIASKN